MADENPETEQTRSGTSPPSETETSSIYQEESNTDKNEDLFGGDQSISTINASDPVETGSREKTRSTIAFILIWTLCGTVLFAMLSSVFAKYLLCFDKEIFLETLRTVLPPLIALVGSVTGFYYGSQMK